ncbi:MAG: AMP-binding protein [Pseudomonadota bacterium]
MPVSGSRHRLLARLHAVVTERGEHTAVREYDRDYSYAALGSMIGAVYRSLAQIEGDESTPVGLLIDRSALAYAAMWACIARGRAYVPLNRNYPSTRLQNIVSQAGIINVICDRSTRELAQSLVAGPDRIVEAAPETAREGQCGGQSIWCQARESQSPAYVLFTSGSTGEPKGVPVSCDNLLAFIDNMNATIEYRPDDVCSQVCELSFDFSVHEIYLALLNGCILCPARQIDLYNPAHYISRRGITVFIAVPSLARVILNNGFPIGNSLSNVRLTVFNGEALTADLARAWHNAAGQSSIWNNYGPTECTVAVTAQLWEDDPDLVEAGVVTIGAPFEDCSTALLSDGTITPTSAADERCSGELLLATPQAFAGYTDPRIAAPFISDDNAKIWYRTGDRVLWRAGKLFHLGRIDLQVKIGGHRIELQEIEHRLRRHLDTESLAVVASPPQHPTELVLFVAGTSEVGSLDAEEVGLPGYMLPGRSVVLDALPTNQHGKLDRSALRQMLKDI